jgi:type II secretory pathway pseudopilin PulG
MEIIGIIVVSILAGIVVGSIFIYSYYNRVRNQNLENINLLNN